MVATIYSNTILLSHPMIGKLSTLYDDENGKLAVFVALFVTFILLCIGYKVIKIIKGIIASVLSLFNGNKKKNVEVESNDNYEADDAASLATTYVDSYDFGDDVVDVDDNDNDSDEDVDEDDYDSEIDYDNNWNEEEFNKGQQLLLQQQKPTPKPTKKKATTTTTTTTRRTTSKTRTKKKETKLEMSKRIERQMEESAARIRTTQTKVLVRKERVTATTTPITTSTPNKMKQQRGGAGKETRLEMKARVKREYAAKAASKKK
mmetsp:Transcript_26164/g.29922  ORF Transcript_26164/g.29922 Transcript_26164/m.29922 type:complete len:262 (+) Transcript_26164:122-907(+)